MPDDLLPNLLVRGDELLNILMPGVSLLEKVMRPLLVYIFLLVGLRLVGKRELSQLNKFDLVVLLILSNTVQNAIIGNDNSVLGGLLGAVVLLGINWVADRYLYSHPALGRLFEGEPTMLVRDGQVLKAPCGREEITDGELLAAIRREGFVDVSEVDQAWLETGGTISIVPKRPTHEEEILARLERIEALLTRRPSGSNVLGR
jgi:uncharacterized membrane protein YcaP (DUF421 family)